MTAAMPEWRAGIRNAKRVMIPAARLLAAALSTLYALHIASLKGGGLSNRRMTRAAPDAPEAIGIVREKLLSRRYIAQGESQEWVLSRDLEACTLHDLRRDLDLDLDISDLRHIPKHGWGKRYSDLIGKLAELEAKATEVSLRSLLTPDSEAEIIEFPDGSDDKHGEPPITGGKWKLLALLGLTGLGSS